MNSPCLSKVPAVSVIAVALATSILAGCSSIPSSGANKDQVLQAQSTSSLPLQVVDIDDAVARRVLAADKRVRFADIFANDKVSGYRVGAGDVVEVSIWEAPPATLFGSTVLDPRAGAATTRVTTFPEQMVSYDGAINVPFAGMVPAAGKSPQQIEAEIARRLQGKANQPQVLAACRS